MAVRVARALAFPTALRRQLELRLSRAYNRIPPPQCFLVDAHDQKETEPMLETNQSSIHPAAIIHPHASIGSGAIVGSNLPGRTIIGSNNIIGHHAVVGVKCQDMKYKQGDECFLYMGNNNDVREFVSVHRSSKSTDQTVIGDNNLIMGCCHIAHDCKVGTSNIFAINSLLAGHVVVEVSQDVPRYMIVAVDRAELRGLNLEGFRRHGFPNIESFQEKIWHLYWRACQLGRNLFSTVNQVIMLRDARDILLIKSLRRAYQKIFMPLELDSRSFEDRLLSVEQNEELYGLQAVKLMVQSVRVSFQDNQRGICKFNQRVCLSED